MIEEAKAKAQKATTDAQALRARAGRLEDWAIAVATAESGEFMVRFWKSLEGTYFAYLFAAEGRPGPFAVCEGTNPLDALHNLLASLEEAP
jgi:hypothetical protein